MRLLGHPSAISASGAAYVGEGFDAVQFASFDDGVVPLLVRHPPLSQRRASCDAHGGASARVRQ